jgi:hypothetical protein
VGRLYTPISGTPGRPQDGRSAGEQ